MSGSEPDQMAPKSSRVVVMPKFDMHTYTFILTTRELKRQLRNTASYRSAPRLPPLRLTMDKLLPKHFGMHISQLVPMGVNKVILSEIPCRSLDINLTVSLFRLFYKLCKQNGTVVSKGDPLPKNQHPQLRTTPPLVVGDPILEKSLAQKVIKKPDLKIVVAKEKKDKQNLAKTQAKRAWEEMSRKRFLWLEKTLAFLLLQSQLPSLPFVLRTWTPRSAWPLLLLAPSTPPITKAMMRVRRSISLCRSRGFVMIFVSVLPEPVEKIKQLEKVTGPKSRQLADAEKKIRVLKEEKNSLVARLDQVEMDCQKIVKEFILVVMHRLHTSVEYRKSLVDPVGLCFTTGWLRGLSLGKKEDEIAKILSECSDLYIEGSNTWKDRHHELFTMQYPYVQKVIDSYLLSLDDLMKVSPDVPTHAEDTSSPSIENNDAGLAERASPKVHTTGIALFEVLIVSGIFVRDKRSRDVITVGSTMRIPLLYRGEYSQWRERFMNYLEEQTDGEAMINSIQNGDQPLPVIAQVSLAGNAKNAPPTLKDLKFWTAEEKKTQKIDRLARSLLIHGLPNDIYSLVDSNETAKDLLDALKRQMCGSEYVNKIGKLDNCELNYKFLNNLQLEWKQYGTLMRQTKNLIDINIDALYNILKQNQGDVNDALGYKKKDVVITSDPLALVAEKTNVSKQKEKVVVSSDSEGSGADDFSELKKITALLEKKAKVKDYNYYKTKMLLAKKDSDEQVLLAEDQAWMESGSDSDQEINANMVCMAQIEKVLSESDESSSSAEETIAEVAYYTSESESESEFKTSEYYDNFTNYGLFVNNDDDQEIFHDE
nr:hypothetical protein [Tanacetum cinerariifolium]